MTNSERQMVIMITEENMRLKARIKELEAQLGIAVTNICESDEEWQIQEALERRR